jgi:heptosyltransferase-2
LRAKNLPALTMTAPSENIVVRSVNWLGDAVMSVPALTRLREAKPNARITLLTPLKLAELWERQPFADEVLAFPPEASFWQVARLLREKRFDTGIAFPNSARSRLELWLGGVPIRVGMGNGLLLTTWAARRDGAVAMRKRSAGEVRRRLREGAQTESIPAAAHHSRHYLHLVGMLGASTEPMAPHVELSEEATERVRTRFGLTRSPGQPWFGLCPGAEYGPAKRWPAERFAEAAKALAEKTGCRWVLFGGTGDAAAADAITRQTGEPMLNLTGKTSLLELAAGLKICEIVLTNDSGPMHLAAAVGARVVAIFGSTSPELTGPIYSPGARILRQPVACAPCLRRACPVDLRCLRGIEPEMAVRAAMDCLK